MNNKRNSNSIQMPEAGDGGFIKTLNDMGYMTSSLDPYSQAFVDFSPSAPGPVLDVGAAFGVASLEALKAGADVIANDMDERHLEILRTRAPQDRLSHLRTVAGSFPDDLDFSEELGAILICRVLHFFDGPKLEDCIRRAYKWLKPGGKLYVVAETPYLKNLRAFTPIYEERKKKNEEWPGFVGNMAELDPVRGASLPESMHFLDPDVLTRVFEGADLSVEEAGFISRKEFPADLKLDGRESVGIVGRKAAVE